MALEILYRGRRFWPLFWTQFFGALNDNLFKNALVVLVTYKGVSLWGLPSEQAVALAGGIFILPFFLFSAWAGQLADSYEKSRVIRATKIWELAIMAIGVWGVYQKDFSLLMVVLFFMGLQSAFFGPVKYSILPLLVKRENLVAANAYVELGTFLAILIGTILGGLVAAQPDYEIYFSAGVLGFAGLGLLTSRFVVPTPIADPNLTIDGHFLKPIRPILRLGFSKRAVGNSILGISWFWLVGAFILSVLPVLVKNTLGASAHLVTVALAIFSIGIGIGSLLCEKLSFSRVELGLVPFGSLGMTLFMFDLGWITRSFAAPGDGTLGLLEFWQTPGSVRIAVDLLLVSVSGGVFCVPLYSLIQDRTVTQLRSRVVAANNIVNSVFMVIGAIMTLLFYRMGLSVPEMFLVVALLNIGVSFYIYRLVPEFALRFLAWTFAHLIYRLRVLGHENIPERGGAILICNHVSFMDWLVIYASIRRPVRFVMYYQFMRWPLVKFLFRDAKVIPIAREKEDPHVLSRALASISHELRRGHIVCLFPEGQLTRDGRLQTFRHGIEKILGRDPVPVVPMVLHGLWGSLLSYRQAPWWKKGLGKLWHRVTLEILPVLRPDGLTAAELEELVRRSLSRGPVTPSSSYS